MRSERGNEIDVVEGAGFSAAFTWYFAGLGAMPANELIIAWLTQ
jgi:hypothetical protein